MTTGTDRIEAIFQDARELQADALEMLAEGRIRNAAEKSLGRDEAGHRRPHSSQDGPARSRSGLRKPRQRYRCCHPCTKPSARNAWLPATTPGRGQSTVTASTWVCATPWTRWSTGSGRRPTTSMTPSA